MPGRIDAVDNGWRGNFSAHSYYLATFARLLRPGPSGSRDQLGFPRLSSDSASAIELTAHSRCSGLCAPTAFVCVRGRHLIRVALKREPARIDGNWWSHVSSSSFVLSEHCMF